MKISTDNPDLVDQTKLLAKRYSFHYQPEKPPASDYYLQLENDGLSLHAPVTLGFKPLRIDFHSAALRYRQQPGQQELLRNLIRLKSIPAPTVIDATAGLGQDGVMLQHLGCHVTLLERSPILAALLDNAVARANLTRLRLIMTNAITYLDALAIDKRPDIIYLDPMYPGRKKSALVKKAMRILRDIVGDDVDSPQLLDHALGCAKHKVIVKRPSHADYLNQQRPTFSHKGKAVRFDVYVLN